MEISFCRLSCFFLLSNAPLSEHKNEKKIYKYFFRRLHSLESVVLLCDVTYKENAKERRRKKRISELHFYL